MNSTIISDLRAELDNLESEFEMIEKKKEAINNLLTLFYPTNAPVKVLETKAKTIPSKVISKNGTVKFSKYLLDIMIKNPNKDYTPQDLFPLMDKAIADGKIIRPQAKVGLKETVGKYLFSFKSRGVVIDGEMKSSFRYSGQSKERREKINNSSAVQIGILDLAIIKMLKRRPEVFYSISTLSNDIRLSEDFGEISKELSGTLWNGIEDSCRKLLKAGVIYSNSSHDYKINLESKVSY